MFANPPGILAGNGWHVMCCSCAHNNCYRVLKADSIRKQLQRANGKDPLSCPAYVPHRLMCKTFSPYVVTFYAILMQQCPGAMIVWDWHDVPQHHRYHFDATVFEPPLQLSHAGFEIDGPCHFRQNYGDGRQQDKQKDAVFNQAGVPMLRLHARDQHQWGMKMQGFMVQKPAGTHYTPQYVLCLPAAAVPRVMW